MVNSSRIACIIGIARNVRHKTRTSEGGLQVDSDEKAAVSLFALALYSVGLGVECRDDGAEVASEGLFGPDAHPVLFFAPEPPLGEELADRDLVFWSDLAPIADELPDRA